MKNSCFLALIITLCFCGSAYSQDTLRLFGHKESEKNKTVPHSVTKTRQAYTSDTDEIQSLTGPGRNVGFYFGFHTGYSQIAGYDAFGASGTFAMIANHGLAIGFSGKGFFTEPYEKIPGSNTSYSITGGYGGFLVEPILFPKFPVHVSFPILLGGGAIAKSTLINYNYPYDYTEIFVDDTEAFLIAEPGMELEFNVTRWLRMGLGASYRFTTNLDSESSFESKPMDGFTGGFSIKIGKF